MAISNEKIFTKTKLPYSLKDIEVIEGYGIHYFLSAQVSNGNLGLLIKSLALQLVKINDVLITESELETLHIRDCIRIVEVINSMMSEL